MSKLRNLNVSRHEFRRLLADNWGKPGEPGGAPWYGRGLFVQHLAPGIFAKVAFCGLPVSGTSNRPVRTLIGITCPTCTRVAKRITRRLEAEAEAAGKGDVRPTQA